MRPLMAGDLGTPELLILLIMTLLILGGLLILVIRTLLSLKRSADRRAAQQKERSGEADR